MTTKRAYSRRVGEEIANEEAPFQGNQAPPQGNKVPPREEVPLGEKAPVNPPAMTVGEIRPRFFNFGSTHEYSSTSHN